MEGKGISNYINDSHHKLLGDATRVARIAEGVTSHHKLLGDATRVAGIAKAITSHHRLLGDATRVAGIAEGITSRHRLLGDATRVAGIAEGITSRQRLLGDATRVAGIAEGITSRHRLLGDATRVAGIAEGITSRHRLLGDGTRVARIAQGKPNVLFKNLIVTKETINSVFPFNVNNEKNVNKIFAGLSPADYELKSELGKKRVNSFVVKKETNEKIPIKSLVSTVGAGDLMKSITKDEAISFYLHLTRFPMLGLEHEVGKKILREMDRIKVISVINKVLYRARPRDPSVRGIPYAQDEMFNAPFGLSNLGRFNPVGQGELYVCDNKDTAIKECSKGEKITVDVIEWDLVEKVKLLDLTDVESPLVQYCSFSPDSASGLEYLVPNFIAQCAKSKGITGIVFISNQEKSALNYVFFDYLTRWFKMRKLEEVKTE